jgi:hypothetical protein
VAQRLSWEQVLAWRLGRQRLVERASRTELVSVVRRIGGLHAQLMSSAELSVWARVDSLERGAVEGALWEERSLVKLWAMRGTLHLLPADELGAWLSALGTITDRGMTGHPRIDALSEAVGRALEGRVLSRDELAAAVQKLTGDRELGEWVGSSWGSYLKPASFRGRLCFAASDDGRVRFTTPETWLEAPIEMPEPADGLREVTRRFLSAYGPATAEELALWWGGYGPARGRRMLEALGDELVEVDVDGGRAWVLAADLAELERAESPPLAQLLPAFDPWVVGAPRRAPALLDPRHRTRVYRPQGWISPVVLVNGRMQGVWRHKRSGQRLLVEVVPFGRLPAWARAQLGAEVDRLTSFLGGELVLRGLGRSSGLGD